MDIEFAEIRPKKLEFIASAPDFIKRTVTIQNLMNVKIHYAIKSTAPNMYKVTPMEGNIDEGDMIKVTVNLIEANVASNSNILKHKFKIITNIIDKGLTDKEPKLYKSPLFCEKKIKSYIHVPPRSPIKIEPIEESRFKSLSLFRKNKDGFGSFAARKASRLFSNILSRDGNQVKSGFGFFSNKRNDQNGFTDIITREIEANHKMAKNGPTEHKRASSQMFSNIATPPSVLTWKPLSTILSREIEPRINFSTFGNAQSDETFTRPGKKYANGERHLASKVTASAPIPRGKASHRRTKSNVIKEKLRPKKLTGILPMANRKASQRPTKNNVSKRVRSMSVGGIVQKIKGSAFHARQYTSPRNRVSWNPSTKSFQRKRKKISPVQRGSFDSSVNRMRLTKEGYDLAIESIRINRNVPPMIYLLIAFFIGSLIGKIVL